ncbi:hypothetical protein SHIRM173S_03747 [Streptomyces hirsutus]
MTCVQGESARGSAGTTGTADLARGKITALRRSVNRPAAARTCPRFLPVQTWTSRSPGRSTGGRRRAAPTRRQRSADVRGARRAAREPAGHARPGRRPPGDLRQPRRHPPPLTADVLRAAQRGAGNAAVTAMIARRARRRWRSNLDREGQVGALVKPPNVWRVLVPTGDQRRRVERAVLGEPDERGDGGADPFDRSGTGLHLLHVHARGEVRRHTRSFASYGSVTRVQGESARGSAGTSRDGGPGQGRDRCPSPLREPARRRPEACPRSARTDLDFPLARAVHWACAGGLRRRGGQPPTRRTREAHAQPARLRHLPSACQQPRTGHRQNDVHHVVVEDAPRVICSTTPMSAPPKSTGSSGISRRSERAGHGPPAPQAPVTAARYGPNSLSRTSRPSLRYSWAIAVTSCRMVSGPADSAAR